MSTWALCATNQKNIILAVYTPKSTHISQSLSKECPKSVQDLSKESSKNADYCSLAVLILNVHTLLRKNGQLQLLHVQELSKLRP